MYECLHVTLLLLDALHLGRQTFRDSSTVTRSGRFTFSFDDTHPAITHSQEQSNYPL